jgi:2-C-methyl-D-erythritol 4-phosphate cytidylyltransferase / 2-C-methyl-D-erythritol 2,4-cyclodiphosphate synthase
MAPSVAAIVVAAGRGLRAGGGVPKQYRCIGGEPIIRSSLALMAWHGQVSAVVPVIHPDDAMAFAAAAHGLKLLPPIFGGATRQASVRAGLEALSSHPPEIVLVHDAARPFCSATLVSRAITACAQTGAAVPALEVSDTIKSVDANGIVTSTHDRATLRSVQTPQAFAYPALLDAHRRAAESHREDFSDDAALAEWAGLKVAVFAGEPGNIKLTTDDDFARAQDRRVASLADLRVGNGVDVHAFGPGDHVMLGGVRIPHDRGLAGHSDADVAIHALVDAILGALADGDIGAHFSPNDPRWRGAASDQFLTFAVERVRARGGRIAHLDLSIVCEAPRLDVHRDAMRERIAAIADIAVERVAVKATTSEKLGFTGRGEGIAAFATATIRLPWTW